MLELGGLDFASPWLLLALTALPALWWLLRVTPPSPRLVSFPPVRLLMALRPNEETPSKTPWWLILLRMLLAALVILALAHPVLNPGENLRGSGPLVMVIDDGWASAADWPLRQQKMSELLNQAEREDRPVHILSTAVSAPGEPLQVSKLMPAANARRIATALAPKPWPVDREAALAALEGITVNGSAHIVWIANGLGQEVDRAFAAALQQLGGLQVIEQPAAARVRLIQTPKAEGETLLVPVQQVSVPREREVWVRAVTDDGRLVGRHKAVFSAGEKSAQAALSLSGELRNEVARIEIEGSSNAGETFLLDERWRRRPVGIVSGDSAETDQPLLSSIYYLDRALRPFAEVRQGTMTELFKREVAVVVLADIGRLLDSDKATLDVWMKRGGVTLRFAGPRLAAAEDDLVPVPLRGGGRALGGAMSWAAPAKLLPFEETSPFSGLDTPPDVRVQRQVLAEPALDLNQKTWARLSDGTPLITAEQRGRGWLVLVHTTANTDWSNLPLSGLFVDILRRIVGLSAGVVSEDQTALLPPSQTLDGYGRLGAPSADAISISARDLSEARPGPATPPGYYGLNTGRRAFNIGATTTDLKPIGDLPNGIGRAGFVPAPSVDFKPWLLLGSLLLAIGDLLVSFVLRGLISARRLTVTTAIAAFAVLTAMTISGPAVAQSLSTQNTAAGPDAKALEATSKTRLAYVVTGDHKLDETTMAGLRGLSDILRRRTAVEPGKPMAIDIENDELAFFPLLYWAVSPRQPLLSEKARRRLNQFLKTGGTILFDTRERGGFYSGSSGGVGAAGLHLRRLMRGLDVPALAHTPKDHVLKKAFYLLHEFPGRWAGGPLWVERRGGRHNDGVSSIIIGANDWAGAWAVDSLGRPMAAVVPGGERQREMAFRFGVNWVMYALTGNYKTDQVHVPAIIDRLGQ
ncbi:MAG: DUF4159 domain-containing protein [Rhodospirillaceae bacterium]|nr:MAG: DUF4159 domain-containing protein [Rhodospirillaceae bacterium]